jgi:hypothetical protein
MARRKNEGPTETQVEDAKRVLRSEYYNSIRSFARDIATQVKKGEIEGEEALRDAIESMVDSSSWVIYTHDAQQVLFVSEHDDAGFEESMIDSDSVFKDGRVQWEAMAYWAMIADMQDMLTKAFKVDLNSPGPEDVDLSD